jgi:type VI secretion system protein ImpL
MTPRLDRALEDLYVSLAERRLAVLNREHGAEWKPAAYEFPREFRKLSPLAVDFLREIGRPSELQVSPVLRGFYFAGVQAVFVTDTAPDQVASAQGQPDDRSVNASSATAVFSALSTPKTPAARAVAAAVPTTRKVPRWDFLPRVIREVVFGDAAAVRLTSAGARVGFWRRLGLGAASVVAVLLAIAFMVSCPESASRARRDRGDSRHRGAGPEPVDLPALDPLRRWTRCARRWTRSATMSTTAPTSLRWECTGTWLYPEVRAAYFGGFNKLMFAAPARRC